MLPQGKIAPNPRLGLALFIQLLLLLPWLPVAALSAMAYDQGSLWPGILLVGPFQAYPAFIGLFLGIASYLKALGKVRAAMVFAWLAPIVSLGSLLIVAFFGSIYMEVLRSNVQSLPPPSMTTPTK
jgi:hypothetical protein